jgi:transposase
MKESIGIDVSMDTLDVALYDGNSYKSKQYENNDKGFREIEKEILNSRKSDKLISMEATGVYHLKAAVYFLERGYTVSVVNPLIIKRYSEMKMLRAKTDSVDARTIATYGFYEKPYYFTRKDNKRERIAQLLKQIDAFHDMQSQNGNRIHAIKKVPGADETVISIYMELADYLKSKKNETEKRIRKILKDDYFDEYKKLIKIPGVGKRVSSIVIGFFGRFENFENAKQVSSFIGLNPSLKQSGVSLKGKGNISKKGNGYIRKIFYMAAISASMHNKSCMDLYARLISRKKSTRVALVAVANKLVRQIFAVAKYDRIYDDNYQKNESYC